MGSLSNSCSLEPISKTNSFTNLLPETICQRLLKDNFVEIENFIPIISQTQQMTLADHLVRTFSACGLIQNLIDWIIQKEIDCVREYVLLFRQDSTNKLVANRIMFGEAGINYTKTFLAPMVDYLRAVSASDVEERKDEITKQAMDIFFKHMTASKNNCPTNIRKLLITLQKRVTESFPKEDEGVPFGLKFLFFNFICPVLVAPNKYLEPKVAPHISSLMVTISKLLRDISLQMVRDTRPEWAPYSEEKFPSLKEFFMKLIDEEDLVASEVIQSPSLKATLSGAQAQRDFEKWIVNVGLNESDEKMEQFLDMLRKNEWKEWKRKDNIIGYTLRDANSNVTSMKISARVKMPLREAAQYGPQSWLPEKNPEILFFEKKDIGDNLTRNTAHVSFPPLCDSRAYCWLSYSKFNMDQKTIIRTSWNKDFPEAPRGLTVGYVHLSGETYQTDESDSSFTFVEHVIHSDPKGKIPSWLTKHSLKGQMDYLMNHLSKMELDYALSSGENSQPGSPSKPSRKSKIK